MLRLALELNNSFSECLAQLPELAAAISPVRPPVSVSVVFPVRLQALADTVAVARSRVESRALSPAESRARSQVGPRALFRDESRAGSPVALQAQFQEQLCRVYHPLWTSHSCLCSLQFSRNVGIGVSSESQQRGRPLRQKVSFTREPAQRNSISALCQRK